MGWRDHIKVHPAAELVPLMSESELRELGEDIKKNGLGSPIIADGGKVLDGRNRLDAMELVGLPTVDKDGKFVEGLGAGSYNAVCGAGAEQIKLYRPTDPYDLVLSLNIHRRHLTAEQKRELVEKILKVKPEQSNRKIAKQTKVDHKTVSKARKKMESTGEIPQLDKTDGADGKKRRGRPPKPKTSKAPAAKPDPVEHRVTGSAEIDVEQRKADMAALEPAEHAPEIATEPEVSEVDRRVECVANTILRHAEGFSVADTVQFFAVLRDRIIDIAAEHCGRTSGAA